MSNTEGVEPDDESSTIPSSKPDSKSEPDDLSHDSAAASTTPAAAPAATSSLPAGISDEPKAPTAAWKVDEVKVTIVGTRDLKSGDWFSDNNVFVTIVDDQGNEIGTTATKKEEDHGTVFMQDFFISEPASGSLTGSLTFTVLDKDTGMFSSSDDELGVARISLGEVVKAAGFHRYNLLLQDPKDSLSCSILDQAEDSVTDLKNEDKDNCGTLSITVHGYCMWGKS
jgi:hypothetical protein